MKSTTAQLKRIQKGFTLIELIIVIAIIGVLAAAVIVAIDPVDKINAANDSKVVQDVHSIYDGALRYATSNGNGFVPDLISQMGPAGTGELKTVPVPPTGYVPAGAYVYFHNQVALGTSTDVLVSMQVKSKSQFTKGNLGTPVQGGGACAAAFTGVCYFVISNGKSCYDNIQPAAYAQCL